MKESNETMYLVNIIFSNGEIQYGGYVRILYKGWFVFS